MKAITAAILVVGAKLAEILEIGLGDRVVATVAQAESGDLSQEMFRISGIYQFAGEEMNSGMAFVRIEKAQEMLAIGNVKCMKSRLKFTAIAYAQDSDTALLGDVFSTRQRSFKLDGTHIATDSDIRDDENTANTS